MLKPVALLFFLLSPLLALTLSAQQSLPPNYTTLLTNPTFKVIKVHYAAHETVPVHDHPDTPTVFVYLNDSGPININHEEPDGSYSTIVRPPTHTGAFRINSGMIERHSIDNPTDLPSDFLRVELLGARLGDKALDFRGPAPKDLSHNLTATEFTSPKLTIVRIICTGPAPCEVPATQAPSVLIAFSSSTITISGKATGLAADAVLSIGPSQTFEIAPTASTPAHILQIAFAPKP